MAFLRLGCTAFGGPVAHLAFFNEDLVKRRQWLDASVYAQLMALCHFIPGPSSSQVGLGIGYTLQGWRGAIAAWLGFTLPSAVFMTCVAVGLLNNMALLSSQAIHYLKIVALVVVMQAMWQMSRTLLLTHLSRCLCLLAAAVLLLVPVGMMQYVVLIVMGGIGFVWLKPESIDVDDVRLPRLRYRPLLIGGLVFVGSFILLAILREQIEHPLWSLVDSMYRSGALVFGGGHVVLPVLQQEAMSHSAIDSELFLAGYGLAQAIPGPLFTFAAYVGALWLDSSPFVGALLATVAILLPSFILVPAILPVWQRVQYHRSARAILAGVNVGVIALLMAVFYQPLFVSTILSAQDVAIAVVAFCGLFYVKSPAWLLVIIALVAGSLF
jgi:chromate transporter